MLNCLEQAYKSQHCGPFGVLLLLFGGGQLRSPLNTSFLLNTKFVNKNLKFLDSGWNTPLAGICFRDKPRKDFFDITMITIFGARSFDESYYFKL